VLRYREGVNALDSGWGVKPKDKNILTWIGTMPENYLTLDAGGFARPQQSTPAAPEQDGGPMREAYRYSKLNRFVVRSQLDCIITRNVAPKRRIPESEEDSDPDNLYTSISSSSTLRPMFSESSPNPNHASSASPMRLAAPSNVLVFQPVNTFDEPPSDSAVFASRDYAQQ
jgi:hypothetical protein